MEQEILKTLRNEPPRHAESYRRRHLRGKALEYAQVETKASAPKHDDPDAGI